MNDWRQALHHFHALTGLAPKLYKRASEQPATAPGTWWVTPGEVPYSTFHCVTLSGTDYAVFSAPVGEHLRDALTWMLCVGKPESTGELTSLAQTLRGYLETSNLQLVAAVTGIPVQNDTFSRLDAPKAASSHPSFTVAVPAAWARADGYLLWLRFAVHAASELQSAQAESNLAEVRNVVEDVLDAFAPGGWREWSEDGVLLWVGDDILTEYLDRDDDVSGTDSGYGARSTLLRRFSGGLLQVLEEDALATATVCVSQKWQGSNSTDTAVDGLLASLVLALRSLGAGLRRDRVAVFGEQTLIHAVQAMTQSAKQMLAQMSGDLGDATTDRGELTQTLQAMMEANLNVSEAARLLFVHRNTLIHRLERIREATGRDLRRFDDAASLLMSLLAKRAQ